VRVVVPVIVLLSAAALAACGGEGESSEPPATTANRAEAGAAAPSAQAPRTVRPLLRKDFAGRLARAAEGAQVGVAVGRLRGGRIASYGSLPAMRAWSTIKVPLAAAVLDARRAGELPGGSVVSAAERTAIEAAITRSDNAAAGALWSELAGALGGAGAAAERVERILTRAGDRGTEVPSEADPRGYSPYGRTDWSLAAAARFYRQLANGRLLAPADTTLLLGAMERVVAEQRWGVGAATWGLAPLRFKGGWGPSDADAGVYQMLQVGLVGSGRHGLVVAIAVEATGFEQATAATSRAAAALARSLL
jgi:beta-lactamase class A